MDGLEYINLSSKELKKIVKAAIRGANRDQKEMVEKYYREKSEVNTKK